jgi:hypothetical protein
MKKVDWKKKKTNNSLFIFAYLFTVGIRKHFKSYTRSSAILKQKRDLQVHVSIVHTKYLLKKAVKNQKSPICVTALNINQEQTNHCIKAIAFFFFNRTCGAVSGKIVSFLFLSSYMISSRYLPQNELKRE